MHAPASRGPTPRWYLEPFREEKSPVAGAGDRARSSVALTQL